MYIRVYEKAGDVLVAACDEDLLGESFSEGDVSISVKETFYKGKKEPVGELISYLKNASIVNLTGKEVIKAAVDAGFVRRENVMMIDGVEHAQIVAI